MRIKQPRARLQPAQNTQNTEARAPCARCRDAHAVTRSCLHTETRAHITAAACRFRSAAVDLAAVSPFDPGGLFSDARANLTQRQRQCWLCVDGQFAAPTDPQELLLRPRGREGGREARREAGGGGGREAEGGREQPRKSVSGSLASPNSARA